MPESALSRLWARLRTDVTRATLTFSVVAGAVSKRVKQWRPFRRRRDGRVALVIGISEYEHANWLENAVNDASAVAASLTGLAFEVALLKNCKRDTIIEEIKRLEEKSEDRKDVVFYFCGHGLQAAGTNYLVPSDGDLIFKGDLGRLIDFQSDVVGVLSGSSNPKVFILDACRNNPFDRTPQRAIERTRKLPGRPGRDEAWSWLRTGWAGDAYRLRRRPWCGGH